MPTEENGNKDRKHQTTSTK